MLGPVAAIGLAIGALALLLVALFLTGRMIYHFHGMVTNCIGPISYLYGAFLVGMPDQFNDQGNVHRLEVRRLFPRLALTYSILAALQIRALLIQS